MTLLNNEWEFHIRIRYVKALDVIIGAFTLSYLGKYPQAIYSLLVVKSGSPWRTP